VEEELMLASHCGLCSWTGREEMSVFQMLSDGKIPQGTPGGALAWAGIAVTGVRAPQLTTSRTAARIAARRIRLARTRDPCWWHRPVDEVA
jgi:hypothetical protein